MDQRAPNVRLSKYNIILDNFSIHRSKNTLDEIKQKRKKIWFVPQYSPSLVSIELAYARSKRFIKDQDEIKSTV